MLQLLQLCTQCTVFAVHFHKLQHRGALDKMVRNMLKNAGGICHTAAVNDVGLKEHR